MRLDRSALRRGLVALLVVGLVGGSVGAIHAAFSASTSNEASSFSSKRLFPRERSTSAWSLSDASTGTATAASAPLAYPESSTGTSAVTTGTWANTWSAARYLEFQYNAPLHGGASVSGVSFNLTFADSDATAGTANQWCYYLDVRKASDGSVLATYGSSGAPLGCEAAAAFKTVSTPLPIISTSDAANDLRIRVYGQHSAGARAARIDRATVTGSSYAGFTLYPELHVDASTGTASTTHWGPAVVNGQAYLTGSWATGYAGTRYLQFTFPKYVPAGATVTGASFDFTYRPQTSGRNACFYFEVYSGGSLIGTHGSSGADVDCNNTAAYETIARPLPEITSADAANGLVVRLYMKISTAGPVQVDGAVLRVTYQLDAGSGCADAGSRTHAALADAFVDQFSPNTTTNGTATTMQVQTRSGRNRRALVWFDLPPLGAGCSLTSASLRLYQSATGGSRTLEVHRLDGQWHETVSWNTQPAYSGAAASVTTGATPAWLSWDTTAQVQAMYASTNHGFIVLDSVESTGSIAQTFHTREGTNAPELVLTTG